MSTALQPRKILCEELQHYGPGDFQAQLDCAYSDFRAWCTSRSISHSQVPFLVRMVGSLHPTCHNDRCTGFVASLIDRLVCLSYWLISQVDQKSGDVALTAKAFNSRIICSWLADVLQSVATLPRHRDHERLMLASVCLPPVCIQVHCTMSLALLALLQPFPSCPVLLMLAQDIDLALCMAL